MSNQVRSVKTVLLMATLSTLTMGNESCEQAQQERVLRMDVELAQMKARSVNLPNGEKIDFPTVIGTLFYGQVMNNPHFVVTNPVPTPQTVTVSGLQSLSTGAKTKSRTAQNDVAWKDVQLLEKFGFDYQGNSSQDAERNTEPDTSLQRSTLQNQALMNGGRGNFGDPNLLNPSKPSATNSSTSTGSGNILASVPTCLYNSPQAILGGDVISFEASYGGGVKLGYAANGAAFDPSTGGSVSFKSTKLDLRMNTVDPLSRQGVVLGDGVAHSADINFSVNFVLGLPIGLDFFYKTALADVIKKGLNRALEQVVSGYKAKTTKKSWDDVWESRVIYDPVIADNDTHIAFRGGQRHDMRAGDRFHITNMRYVWEGAACNSLLKYKIPLTAMPGALVEIISVGDNVAVAKVLDYYSEEPILPGAMVKVESLKEKREQQESKKSGGTQTLASR